MVALVSHFLVLRGRLALVFDTSPVGDRDRFRLKFVSGRLTGGLSGPI